MLRCSTSHAKMLHPHMDGASCHETRGKAHQIVRAFLTSDLYTVYPVPE